MKFVLELPLQSDLSPEDLIALHGHRTEIRLNGKPAQIEGAILEGSIIGASVSPEGHYLRVVVDCES